MEQYPHFLYLIDEETDAADFKIKCRFESVGKVPFVQNQDNLSQTISGVAYMPFNNLDLKPNDLIRICKANGDVVIQSRCITFEKLRLNAKMWL